jgi:hypothetical protein
MNQISREAALLFKGPRGSPDSENVDARGSESNIEDANTEERDLTDKTLRSVQKPEKIDWETW